MVSSSLSVWLLTDGKIGDRVQCLGIAKSLGSAYEEKIVSSRHFGHRLFSPTMGGQTPLIPPFPDLAIASGRRAIAWVRWIKRASQGKTFTVILKDPRTSPDICDMLWVPAHDHRRFQRLAAPNVITTLTSPHGITQDMLHHLRRAPPLPPIAALPKPRLALVLGDPTPRSTLYYRIKGLGHSRPKSAVARLCEGIGRLTHRPSPETPPQVGGMMLTTSRRTPDPVTRAVLSAIGSHPAWVCSRSDSYAHMLAHADGIVVTGDSHNMVSEALATGKPVFVLTPDDHNAKLAWFVNQLADKGLVRLFDGRWQTYSSPPVDATKDIAHAIIQAMGNKRASGGAQRPTEEQ